jgi:two-component system, NarL family, nitrate/nitrite sensor histidine kinase NarX
VSNLKADSVGAFTEMGDNECMKGLFRGGTGIQRRLAWVFLAFLVLVIVAVTLTYQGLAAEQQDARIINLAGRQRMLVQEIARLATEYEQESEDHYREDMLAAADSFGQTLRVLRQGGLLTDYTGQVLVLPPPRNARVIRELDALDPVWQRFRANLDGLTADDATAREVGALAPDLVDQADRVVRAFEAVSQDKITQLHWFQIAFLLAGLALLGLGWWIVHVSVVRPIWQIEQAARRIGEGDLESPVVVGGPAEVVQLGREMEKTRLQLRASRQESQSWVETLERRVQQRTAELEALAAVSREIASHLEIGAVLKSVTEKAQHLLGSEVAELCLVDPDGGRLDLHATAGPAAALITGTSAIQEEAAGLVLHGRTARACDAESCPGFCEILDPAYRASHLAAPLHSGDRVVGILCVGNSRKGAFRPDAVSLLTQLASTAAVALENSRLYDQAETAATLLERQRIASEMHDGLLQTLSFLRLMTQQAEEQASRGETASAHVTLQKVAQANVQAEREIRQAITSLQAGFPEQVTLQRQVAEVIEESVGAGPAVEFENHLSTPLILPRQESEQVLRVLREALLNAQRHGRAGRIGIVLDREDREIVLAVEDDGIGFDPTRSADGDRPHFGIKIMQARASRLGGAVQLDSAPGAGTRVTLRWQPSLPERSPGE